ncbi:MAG: hypothetical protein M4579_005433 [Chaenotheca gracillima]|nr:MAG: hypothetical protein M4579_005433 [Chaenotheca gracillima]
MGWFWADTTSRSSGAPSRLESLSNGAPPPGCPMHESAPAPKESKTLAPPSDGSCPYTGRDSVPSSSRDSSSESTLSKLNPLNFMPSSISQARSENQSVDLPTSRETSSIPKGAGSGNWEYPSPQQMYNAMLRKGYADTPQDAVESMVAVHNFLNEGAWAEIVEWERRFGKGLGQGWQECKRGESASLAGADMGLNEDDVVQPKLLRFMGRPKDMTPKASILQMLGWVNPEKYGGEPPFDRHDWFVQRPAPGNSTKEIRYVIDYYSGPPEPTGEPVFYLDVRPAVDRPGAAAERLMRWGGDIWWRASGGLAREKPAQESK